MEKDTIGRKEEEEGEEFVKIVNIHNKKSKIFLFVRDDEGKLSVKSDISLFPYFYEPNMNGKYVGYDGTPLKKVVVGEPREIKQVRSDDSFESDLLFPKRYIIDRIKTFDKCPIKWAMIDIEVLADEFPEPAEAKYPISCITVYNSFSKEYKTWFVADYKGGLLTREKKLIKDFVKYMQEEKFDLWLSWNVSFDYHYVANRVKNIFNKTFAKIISPIKQVRFGTEDVFYPAGISIVDYLGLFRKVYNQEMEYNLDYILTKFTGKGKTYKDIDFGKLSFDIKKRNQEDVKGMVTLETDKNLIPYYDEIRRFSHCVWEDLPMQLLYRAGKQQLISNNSKIIDMLLLREAKERNIVLPNKTRKEKEEYKGATRDAEKKGRFFNLAQLDLDSAYLRSIINFCLDTTNILEKPSKTSIEIEGIHFEQNSNTLLPTVAKMLLKEKSKIKELKEKT